jgi:hypothetical protein
MKTYTIKPGDTIVAKVDGIERTCKVLNIGEKIIIVRPLRTKRAAPYEPLYCLLVSDIISIITTN